MPFRSLALAAFALACASPAPAQEAVRAFVAVEPFEFRVEAIVKVAAYRESWRLEGELLGEAEMRAVLDNLLVLLRSGFEARIPDGPELRFGESSARFFVPDPERGYAPDERSEIPVEEALVGLSLSAPARGVSAFEMEWLWFAPDQERLVLEIASRGKPSARLLRPAQRKLSWRLEGEAPLPEMLEVPSPRLDEARPLRPLLYPGLALVAVAAVLVVRWQTRSPAWVAALVAGGIALAAIGLGYRKSELAPPRGEASEDLVYALLRNVYHAFDFRDESAIYDTLERSVTGPLLERVYLEVRSSLELESAGGPRVRVHEIALRDCGDLSPAGSGRADFRTRAEWATIGEVTHWGHTHERTNRYEAEVTLRPEGGAWRVAGLDLLNEERVQKTTRRTAAEP